MTIINKVNGMEYVSLCSGPAGHPELEERVWTQVLAAAIASAHPPAGGALACADQAVREWRKRFVMSEPKDG